MLLLLFTLLLIKIELVLFDGGVESLNGDCSMVTGEGDNDEDNDNDGFSLFKLTILWLLLGFANSS